MPPIAPKRGVRPQMQNRPLNTESVCDWSMALAVVFARRMRVEPHSPLMEDVRHEAVVAALECLARFDPSRVRNQSEVWFAYVGFARVQVVKVVQRYILNNAGAGLYRVCTRPEAVNARVCSLPTVDEEGTRDVADYRTNHHDAESRDEIERVFPVTEPVKWWRARCARIKCLSHSENAQSWGIEGHDGFGLWWWIERETVRVQHAEYFRTSGARLKRAYREKQKRLREGRA